jgi:hypothetical protein
MRTSIICLTVLCVLAPDVNADQRAATACANRLPEPAFKIYTAVLKEKNSGTDLTQVVREQTIALVQAGQILMSTAPDNALAAAKCLEVQR